MTRSARALSLLLFALLPACYRSRSAHTSTSSAATSPSPAAAPASAPTRALPSGPTTPTQKSIGAIYRKYEEAFWLGGYERTAPHDPRWDEAAKRFLDLFIRCVTDTPEPVPLAKVVRAARDLDRFECDDPIVVLAMAEAYQAARKKEDALSLYFDLEPLFGEGVFAVELAWVGPLGLARCGKASEYKPGGREELRRKAVLKAVRAASLGEYGPFEEDWLWWRLRPDHEGPPAKEFLAALRQRENASQWILNMLKGELALHEAHLGKAGSDRLRLLAEAHDAYVKAYELHPEYAIAAARLIECPGPQETTRMWFDRAVAANFDCPDAYHAYRAHLSPPERLAFGRECLATRRFDTLVPWELGLAVGELVENETTAAMLSMKGLAEELEQLADGYQRTRPKLAEKARALAGKLPAEPVGPGEQVPEEEDSGEQKTDE